jgi:hypothetical protein
MAILHRTTAVAPRWHWTEVTLFPTLDQSGSLWSFAEESVAIICACMPAIRKLLSNYLPNIFDMGGSSNKNDVLQFSTFTIPDVDCVCGKEIKEDFNNPYG